MADSDSTKAQKEQEKSNPRMESGERWPGGHGGFEEAKRSVARSSMFLSETNNFRHLDTRALSISSEQVASGSKKEREHAAPAMELTSSCDGTVEGYRDQAAMDDPADNDHKQSPDEGDKKASRSIKGDIKSLFSKDKKYKKPFKDKQPAGYGISYPITKGIDKLDKARSNLMTWISCTYHHRPGKKPTRAHHLSESSSESAWGAHPLEVDSRSAGPLLTDQLELAEPSDTAELSDKVPHAEEDPLYRRRGSDSSPPRDYLAPPCLPTYFSGGNYTDCRSAEEPISASHEDLSFEPSHCEESDDVLYTSFEDLLLSRDLGLIKAFCSCLQVADMNKICTPLIRVLEYNKCSVPTIKALIYYESSLQKTSATLFRNNSFTTNLLTSYTKLVGTPFLKTTIGMIMLNGFELIDSGECTFEIDPTLLKPGEDLNKNISDLKQLVREFLNNIINSRAVIPRSFMEICYALRDATSAKFPEARYFVVGGFIFLRLICPAMVLPEGYKIIDSTISNAQRRMLVLACKILQTLANQRNFGEKESYMMVMNPIISEYQEILQYFFSVLSKPPSPDMPENIPTIIFTPEDYEQQLRAITGQIEAIKSKLLSTPKLQNYPKVCETLRNLDSIPLTKAGHPHRPDRNQPPSPPQ